MRCAACYPTSVRLSGTPPWCVVLGLTVVCAWATPPVSWFGRPPEYLILSRTRVVKLVVVRDFPPARMTRLIHPDCVRRAQRRRMRCSQNALLRQPRVSWLWMCTAST